MDCLPWLRPQLACRGLSSTCHRPRHSRIKEKGASDGQSHLELQQGNILCQLTELHWDHMAVSFSTQFHFPVKCAVSTECSLLQPWWGKGKGKPLCQLPGPHQRASCSPATMPRDSLPQCRQKLSRSSSWEPRCGIIHYMGSCSFAQIQPSMFFC